MKKLIYIFSLFLIIGKVTAQNFSPNETYTYTRVFLDSVTVGSSNINTAQSIQNITYTDGLGRPKQDIVINAIKSGQDIVNTNYYDTDGRLTKEYLPIAISSQGGLYQPVSTNDINGYYNTPNAFSEIKYDDSPLNRPVKKASPGSDWSMTSGHTQEFFYEFNGDNSVRKYVATLNISSFENSFGDNGFYAINTLNKRTLKDEDGNLATQYTNGLGQVILKRVKNGAQDLDTYYVYNQYSQLAYIIPPLNDGENISDPIIRSKIAYEYNHDAQGRLKDKKLPGKGKEHYVYDKENRVIMSTNSRLLSEGKWYFIKYDKYGRTLYTGLCTGGSRAFEQQNADDTSAIYETRTSSIGFKALSQNIYYTKLAYPTTFIVILSINYYDSYPIEANANRPSDILSQATLTDSDTSIHNTKSLATASYVKNVENSAWTKTFFWYDTKERLVGNHKINSLGGLTRTEMKLDFPGNITESRVYHSRNSVTTHNVLVKQRYVYSAQNLLLRHYHQVNTEPEELLKELFYDDLGRLTNKKIGNNLQDINYSYNVRGWLTSMNDPGNLGTDLFAFKMNFNYREGVESPNNDYPELQVKPKFNGSISETAWATAPDFVRRYGYVYDASGRLTAGMFQADEAPYNKEHSEILTYDKRGNINTLFRTSYKPLKGAVRVIDNLLYNNDGNRILNINDLSANRNGYEGGNAAISYDDNGNITAMPDKGIIGLGYNFLNLPNVIYDKNTTTYLYSADGTKLRKTLQITNDEGTARIITEYVDGFQYSTSNTSLINRVLMSPEENAEMARTASEPEAFIMAESAIPSPGEPVMQELVFFPTAEGYYDYKNKKYIYQYKDHLGNVRMSYYKNTAGLPIALDNNNYYPFGMNHLSSGGDAYYDPLNATPYNYKYNGKELQETGMYDYGWRMYMPDIARWNGIDQLAEKFNAASPYAYVMNNPISFFDPDGRYSSGGGGNWWDNVWKSAKHGGVTTYSDFDSNGNWGSSTFAPMSSEQFTSFYNFLSSGQTGMYGYWTGTPNTSGYYNKSDNMMYGTGDMGVLHWINIKGQDNSWEGAKNWADWSATTMEGMFKYASDSRTNFYNNGNWIDNLGNVRSLEYAGRAKGSLIGLRSDYVKTTAKFGKYAERAGWVGYGISAIEIGEGISKDKGTYGQNAQVATAKAVGGIVGAAEGALIGAYVGSFIPVPGAGTILGLVVGAGVGYIYSEIAGQAVEHIYENR